MKKSASPMKQQPNAKRINAKREAEAADAAEQKAVAQAKSEAKRQADIDAEATRRSDAAARAKEIARAEAMQPPRQPHHRRSRRPM